MPELSRFFGIIIRMYMEVGEPHHTPHFHAYYQDDVAQREQEMGHHPIHRVTSFRMKGQYRIQVGFDDGSEQTIDFGPVLFGEMYGPLRNPSVFNQVRLDPEVHTLVWPNGADFDPATLHDWPQNAEALAQRAQQWDLTPLASN